LVLPLDAHFSANNANLTFVVTTMAAISVSIYVVFSAHDEMRDIIGPTCGAVCTLASIGCG
jgi:hypothetical protein